MICNIINQDSRVITSKYTHQYSVNDKQILFVLLKYIVVTKTATNVSNKVCKSKKRSNDVTTIPTVHASIKV